MSFQDVFKSGNVLLTRDYLSFDDAPIAHDTVCYPKTLLTIVSCEICHDVNGKLFFHSTVFVDGAVRALRVWKDSFVHTNVDKYVEVVTTR